MGLSEVRNHANLILNIIRLITKKENFYDVKNEVMESVRSVIPCEKISINMIPKENVKEVQLVYSYTNKSSFGEGIESNLDDIISLPRESYSDFIWNAVSEGIYSYTFSDEKNYQQRAVFPIITSQGIDGFIYFLFKKNFFLSRDNICFLEEIGLLLGISIERTELNKKILESKMRQREMAIAFDMQQNVMSENNLLFLNGGRINYLYKYGETMKYLPKLSKRLGGDYCEIIPFENRSALVFIADVMGHGASSNYFVPMMKGILKTCVSMGVVEPKNLMNQMNQLLMKELDKANLFITAQAVYINFEDNMLYITNAGHTEPILFSQNEDMFWYSYIGENKGLPLGIDSSVQYTQNQISADEYDMLLLYTDGILEATNINGVEYGTDGIIDFCRKNKGKGYENFVDRLYEDVLEYLKHTDTVLQDDIMLIGVELGTIQKDS